MPDRNDGEDGVAIVGHRFKVSSFNSVDGWRRGLSGRAFLTRTRLPARMVSGLAFAPRSLSTAPAGRGGRSAERRSSSIGRKVAIQRGTTAD